MNKYKTYLRYFWGGLILSTLVIYIVFPDWFTPKNISLFLEENHSNIWFWYVFFTIIRALFFIPSTVLVLTGIVLFPDSPYEVFSLSMIGILIGASLIYFGADWLRPEVFYQKKTLSEKMNTIHTKMERFGPIIVLIWAFIPIVPTDLICYISGTIKMTFWKFILALVIGESILVSTYVFAGKSLMEIIF